MASPRHAFLPLLALCLVLRHAAAQQADERQLLLRIKSAWGDPAGLASWSAATSSHCAGWAYVSCDGAGRVTSLALPNVTVSGPVPDAIGGLPSLATLDLSNTSVSGGFPKFLYNCTGLTYLDLSMNRLSGDLPADIGRLGENLTYLALNHNGFTGQVPPALSKLKNLTVLALGGNQLTGTIPPELGELTGLQTLKLELNPFGAGKLPDSFKNLTKLTTLWLGACNLTGDFPSYVTDMSEMVWLDLSTNAFTGSIPPSIWNLPKLQVLYIFSNNLTGDVVINGAIGAAGLIEIDLSFNMLTGVIPERLGTLSKLIKLCMSGNGFSGEIPASLAQLPSLVFLWLFNNKLNGVLPAELGMHSPSLRDIQVDGNDLSGPIPAGVCKNRGLWIISASGNRLNGSIPTSLANCPALISLQLQDNELSGEVPAALWTETKLMTLLLQNNGGLTGTLPETLFWNMTRLYIMNNKFRGGLPSSGAKLQKFNAGNNLFSGEIPAGLATGMPLLQEFSLSSNQLSGTIPASIASLGGLTQMNFSRNQLTGEIPAGLGSMPVLTLLDLSSNQLSGSIPPALGSLRLNQLNLSSNNLAGEVPASLAISAYDRSFLGNRALCTGAASSGNLAGVSSCAGRSSDKVSPGLRTGLVAAAAALLVVIAALAFFIVRDIKKRKGLAPPEEAWKLTHFQPLDFGEAAVLRGLADENLIGKGGSGRVYRVECPSRSGASGGTVVAVKRIWTGGKVERKLEREFESEVDVLGHVRHTNIVKLLCCLSRAETKLLVYEYMDNGSLDKWLHGHRWPAPAGSSMAARAPSVRRAPLDWPARVRVAVGAARGLSYMHHECSPPVVHRDVKCSNILLDSELNAKVADFGLARILAEAAGTTPHDTMSAVAGTFGYMAPECAYTRKANEKVDVYSFGVVLLELATGREAGSGGEHCSLAEWAWRHLQSGKSIADAADECIGDARNSDDFEVVFKLGIICTGAQPSTRPTMKDVLQILLRCEQAHRKTIDEKTTASEYDAAPLLPAVRGGSRRKRLSDAADGKGSFDDVVLRNA
ncbi:receptor-like protein kinase HSL1 [Hordeum vulgare subsp. vulgare]|uniref:Protein kinase domain-containing protein n=1 Tax=Hordeum vulgare subsp. vulgare TaxID=112509 RepID=A0A8I6W7G6_HORVV|nr:receptor-like protein kinase HSL1 [Hordeum vulgare subsp. vulgare]